MQPCLTGARDGSGPQAMMGTSLAEPKIDALKPNGLGETSAANIPPALWAAGSQRLSSSRKSLMEKGFWWVM